ncbi:MAG: hypothetical protein J3R72DRAFT_458811 [Linnemannia gamsii]|nr:MAG: hypothetical protein J3R72DRAFT_458811 [Linnemannia gamsii]
MQLFLFLFLLRILVLFLVLHVSTTSYSSSSFIILLCSPSCSSSTPSGCAIIVLSPFSSLLASSSKETDEDPLSPYTLRRAPLLPPPPLDLSLPCRRARPLDRDQNLSSSDATPV